MSEKWEKYYIEIDGKEIPIELFQSNHSNFKIRFNGKEFTANLKPISENAIWQLSKEGRNIKLYIKSHPQVVFLHLNGWNYECKVQDEKSKKLLELVKKSRGDEEFHFVAPMPGLLLKFLKKEGDKIQVGEPLAILSAMKMENELRSNVNGVVKKIHIPEQTSVEKGTLLATVVSGVG